MNRIAVIVSLILGALAAPAVAEAATVTPRWHGVQVGGLSTAVSPAAYAADLDQARRLGANIVRVDLAWAELEPTEGSYDAAALANADGFFAAARARGIKVMPVIASTPCWNSTAPAPDCSSAEGRKRAAQYQPRDLEAFARIAAFVAARYGGAMKAIEIWNEPDQRNELYWAGPGKVDRYARLLKLAYPAIKRASPTTTVLAGALVGGNGAFLEALYKQGIKGSYDALSVHFYDLALYQLGTIRQIRRAYGDRTPMWLGEFGFTSCLRRGVTTQLGGHACVTRAEQARHTLDVLRAIRVQRDLEGAMLYTLRDGAYDFGMLDRSGRRKPIFDAIAAAYRGRYGTARKVTVRLRVRDGRVTASGSGPVGDAYQIDVTVRGLLRYRAAFRLDRHGRYALRLPRALGRTGLRATVRQYTLGGRPAVAALT